MAKHSAGNDKDLRRLHRADLLELLEELSRENDRLRAELDEANRKLESRDLTLSRCGSLAEASLALSGVFEAADEAARTYVEACKRAAGEGSAPSLRPMRPKPKPRPQSKPQPSSEGSHSASPRSEVDFAAAVDQRLAEKRKNAKHAKQFKGGKHSKKHKGKK